MKPLRPMIHTLLLGLAVWWGSAHAAEADHAHAGDDTVASDQGAPRTPVPRLTDADREAARPPATSHTMHDDAVYSYSLINRLEAWDAEAGRGLGWQAGGWIGRDINRLWWHSEGERVDGRTGSADLELLFGHSFAPRWDWLAGLRQDLEPRPTRTFAAFGLRGLAPQWFEVSAMAYVGEGGRTAARLESSYSLLLTNRLVLQPMFEARLHGKDDTARGIGSGLGTIEFGLRLRYEFTRQFAPYLGVSRDRAFGRTADLRRAESGSVVETRWVAGLRLWF